MRPSDPRPALATACACLALLSACGPHGPAAAPAPPGSPNVVLITLDGLRRDHLSFFGYPRQTSPSIDWLAQQGLAFSEIIPSSCSTKASLTSLLTSLDYPRHAMEEHDDVLPDEVLTLAEVFHAHGYATAGFVGTAWLARSLHYGQGFDVYRDYKDFKEKGRKGVHADRVIGEVLEYLRGRAAHDPRPFFVYVHVHEPHPPWQGGSLWLDEPEAQESFFDQNCTYVPSNAEIAALPDATRRHLVAKYDGAIRFADAWIGVLLATLQQRGLTKNSVIAVSADHGMGLLDHFSGGHGNTPFEEVTRGFLVLFDGRKRLDPAEQPSDAQGRIFDVGPTLLALAGIEAPPGLDGVDLLHDAQRLPELAFTTCYSGEVARSRAFKLIRFDAGLRAEHAEWPRGVPGEWMLVDLAADPGETRDVSAAHPEVFARMRGALEKWGPGTEPRETDAKRLEALDPESRERLRELGYVK